MNSKEEVRQARKGLFHHCLSYSLVSKGDRRIKTTRICSVCSRILTSHSQDGPTVITPHYRIHAGSILHISICKDIRSCYRNTFERKDD